MGTILQTPTPDALAALVPWPAPDANKYTRGKLTAVGGASAYPGAICMASAAAYTLGAGYVEVVCAPQTLPVVHAFAPDVVARSWEGWTPMSSKLDEYSDGCHPRACLVGSGMDAAEAAEAELVFAVLEECACPVVVDGGAITALATERGRALADQRHRRGLATIVTPHFGEAVRLGRPLGLQAPARPAADLQADADFARALADAYGAVVVLKGPSTFVARPAEDGVLLMDRGTAALAKAGTGDVLAGMVSSLAAQGLAGSDAGILGATLHAEAGRLAAATLTELSVRAPDVIHYLPQAVQRLTTGT